MQSFSLLAVTALLSTVVASMTVVAIQNAEVVSLKFLFLESVPIPVGLVLTFCLILGMLATAIALSLFAAQAE